MLWAVSPLSDPANYFRSLKQDSLNKHVLTSAKKLSVSLPSRMMIKNLTLEQRDIGTFCKSSPEFYFHYL